MKLYTAIVLLMVVSVTAAATMEKTRKDDQEHSKKKRIAGAVIAAAQLTVSLLTTFLDRMQNIERKIALGIANETPYRWEALNVYFFSGTADGALPEYVPTDKAVVYPARKTNGPTATGCVGVLAYYIPGVRKTLAVLFSVPFDYNLYSNWWDAKVYNGQQQAHRGMYDELYKGNPFQGDNGYHTKQIGGGFQVKGVMTSGGSCKQKLTISS